MNVAQKFFEAFYNANDPERASALVAELLAEDFTDHSPAFGATPDKAGFGQTVAMINRTFRQNYRVTRLLQDGDTYVGIWQSQTQHVGDFMGVAPTDKIFPMEGITIYQIQNGQITAHWEQFTVLNILQAVGLVQLGQPEAAG